MTSDSCNFPELPTVDGLISAAEQRYLYWLTSSMYAEEGAVVELGSWFGRSAIALGAGLRDSGRSTPLHCFDRFRWNPAFASSIKIADVRLPDGGDFIPYFLSNVLPVYPHVHATKTTIEELEWDGGPIEILFVDAPKTFADLTKTLLVFGPHLTVGRSLVVLQDFFFTPAYPDFHDRRGDGGLGQAGPHRLGSEHRCIRAGTSASDRCRARATGSTGR